MSDADHRNYAGGVLTVDTTGDFTPEDQAKRIVHVDWRQLHQRFGKYGYFRQRLSKHTGSLNGFFTLRCRDAASTTQLSGHSQHQIINLVFLPVPDGQVFYRDQTQARRHPAKHKPKRISTYTSLWAFNTQLTKND